MHSVGRDANGTSKTVRPATCCVPFRASSSFSVADVSVYAKLSAGSYQDFTRHHPVASSGCYMLVCSMSWIE
ncbi:hypothetical protein SeMB42_g05526 [Synchytrium endobioticum]|uniref:Uncharacterized protein n=1 Tax=Synchytrium endobioticum TaxID=286115 RepID=A0A507CQW7_9FUNG|nr:hypothetical protein SeMB42_g05526 [Synchytrium endobioticum]